MTHVGRGSQLPTSFPVRLPHPAGILAIAFPEPFGAWKLGSASHDASSVPNVVAVLSTPAWHLVAPFRISEMIDVRALPIAARHFPLSPSPMRSFAPRRIPELAAISSSRRGYTAPSTLIPS